MSRALSLTLALAVVACGDDAPTEGDARADTGTTARDVRQLLDTVADPVQDQAPDAPDVDNEPDTLDDPTEGEPVVVEDPVEDPVDEPDAEPIPCLSHDVCGDHDLCSEGFCIPTMFVEVVLDSEWTVDPYTTLIEFCPDAAEELREQNPVESEGFPMEVETPDGPGVRSQAEGDTIWCCGCTRTLRRFELPPIETADVFLSFWFDSGFIGDPGPWNQPTLGVLLLSGDEEVGSIRFSQFADRYSNCPYEDVYEPAKAQRIRLDDLYDGVIDAIVMEMGHYACEGTNYVTVGPLRIGR